MLVLYNRTRSDQADAKLVFWCFNCIQCLSVVYVCTLLYPLAVADMDHTRTCTHIHTHTYTHTHTHTHTYTHAHTLTHTSMNTSSIPSNACVVSYPDRFHALRNGVKWPADRWGLHIAYIHTHIHMHTHRLHMISPKQRVVMWCDVCGYM